MLRVCKTIDNNPIFELQEFAEHLVCDIWCEADESDCISKVHKVYEPIISYKWLREEIIEIDQLCEGLSPFARLNIKNAFKINNKIEELCNGQAPVYLNQLPDLVEDRMKPLFIRFYEELLERSKVGGDKLEFYKVLYKTNRFKFCVCCGYMPFDTGQIERREAYDHYLPKSEYPFASVNFKNLVPLCYKCNSDRKKDKDPIRNRRKAFYPYRSNPINIEISTTLGDGFIRSLYESVVNDVDEIDLDVPKIEEVDVNITSQEQEQVDTWDDLFQIKARFSERTGQFSFSHLRKMKRRFSDKRIEDGNWKFIQTIDYHIADYEKDKYTDEKYLKIPFMHAIKKCNSLINIYI
jgi:hypothetical protein